MATIAKDVSTATPNNKNTEGTGRVSSEYKIVYVLGGPGSGKDTQCSKIAAYFGFSHLCVGELLEKVVSSGSQHGSMIKQYKMEGKLVPNEIVIKILQEAMEESPTKKFLINGFPRSEDNRVAADNMIQIEPEFVLFLDCTREVMMARLLNRNQGRVDDNVDTVTKRLKLFFDTTMPVVEYYSAKGKVVKVNGEQTQEEVFEELKLCFQKFKFSRITNKSL